MITAEKMEAAFTQLKFEAYVSPMGKGREQVMAACDEVMSLPQESRERLAHILSAVFSGLPPRPLGPDENIGSVAP